LHLYDESPRIYDVHVNEAKETDEMGCRLLWERATVVVITAFLLCWRDVVELVYCSVDYGRYQRRLRSPSGDSFRDRAPSISDSKAKRQPREGTSGVFREIDSFDCALSMILAQASNKTVYERALGRRCISSRCK